MGLIVRLAGFTHDNDRTCCSTKSAKLATPSLHGSHPPDCYRSWSDLQRNRPPIARKTFLSFLVDEHRRAHLPGTWNPALPTTDLEDRHKELTVRIHRLPHLVWKTIGAWCRINRHMLQLGPDFFSSDGNRVPLGRVVWALQTVQQPVGRIALVNAHVSVLILEKVCELIEWYLALSPITFLKDLLTQAFLFRRNSL